MGRPKRRQDDARIITHGAASHQQAQTLRGMIAALPKAGTACQSLTRILRPKLLYPCREPAVDEALANPVRSGRKQP